MEKRFAWVAAVVQLFCFASCVAQTATTFALPTLPLWPVTLLCGATLLAVEASAWGTPPALAFFQPYAMYIAAIALAMTQAAPSLLAAFFSVPLILFPLDLLHQYAKVNYETQSVGFVVSRSAFYAVFRAVCALLRSHIPLAADRLIVVAAATLETIFMVAVSSKSYAFSTRSRAFVSYALVKTSVFLWLPWFEELLIRTYSATP